MLIIGSHVSFGPKQILSSVKEAIENNANTFMFYTGAPTNTIRKEINKEWLEEAKKLMDENCIDIKNVICHAPYIINLANKSDLEKWNFSVNFLKNEVLRCDEMGIKTIVVHPGNAIGITKEEGLDNIIEALNQIIDNTHNVTIAIETMAGKGTECGNTIEEIATIINGVDNELIGVCLDTCHLNDGGYDMSKFNDYLDQFEKLMSINKIKCLHINDSKNIQGSKKDRHANIGFGTIGFDSLINIINHHKLEKIPKILETPYIGENNDDKNRLYSPYKWEIAMIKSGKFDHDILEKIRDSYKK